MTLKDKVKQLTLAAKIEQLNKSANTIHELICLINIRASELIGVVAIIPQNAPAPASYFKGRKVILHNVSFDRSAGCISAAITFPYTDDTKKLFSGCTQRFNIDKTWFE